jgi:predicted transcriptional regulator
MSKVHLSFRLRPDLAEAIRAAAEADRRPPSQFLSNLVEDALAARKQPAAEQHRGVAA